MRYRISEFEKMVHPRDGHPKIFAMIDAYLDESGIHDGAAICVIAGYWGGRGQWKKFEKAWRRVLSDAGVPMEDFHAKDFVKKNKYEGLITSLSNTIASFARKIHPISAAIIVPDFYSFSEVDRRFLTGATLRIGELEGTGSPDKPYYIPFQHCLKKVCRYAPVGGKAHFFFGLDRTFSGYAQELFKQAKLDPRTPLRERFGDIDFPLAKETPELQAADLLVHLTYLYCLEMIRTDAWGKIQPDGPLRGALYGTQRQDDHTFQDKGAIKAILTESVEKFTKACRDAGYGPVTAP